jgi:retinol dehydrogenase-13
MKTAIVTGAYGVIGTEISRDMVVAGYQTAIVGRNIKKLEKLKDTLLSEFDGASVEVLPIDLSRKDAIFEVARNFDYPLAVLINNAATTPPGREENEDGIELQWATNVLGYYWMIRAFEANLRKAKNGRIVNVASYWAGGLDLEDPEFKQRPYNNNAAYRQSKQADRMLAYGFAEEFGDDIAVNACHPGDANSKLSNNLGFGGSESAAQSAATPLFLALHKDAAGITGGYFAYSRQANCQFKNDASMISELMQLCSKY